MEVGCLEYPRTSTIGSQPLDWNNAPKTGTTALPSHEPQHERKETGTRHTENISGEKANKALGERGGEENGWQNLARKKTERANESHDWCSQQLGMRMLKTADLRN